ncbi:hypothetical protein JZO67_004223 [Enterococcus sp. 665A]|uniref:Uncharacterized protein n=1 Tax=Candidatus Enterococcus ferrettii TaxID=2815324 RepID=A0ABV0EUL8_9ENTE
MNFCRRKQRYSIKPLVTNIIWSSFNRTKEKDYSSRNSPSPDNKMANYQKSLAVTSMREIFEIYFSEKISKQMKALLIEEPDLIN